MRWSLAFILSSVAPSFLSRLLSTSRAAYSSSALILLSRFLHSHRARLYMFLPLSRSFNKNRQCQASVLSLNSIVFFIDPSAPQYPPLLLCGDIWGTILNDTRDCRLSHSSSSISLLQLIMA